MLEKLAKQLIALDEATLMSLWDEYYAKVQRFEPTKKWEEAVLVLAMIQSVRWKNQLFNVKWNQQRSPGGQEDRNGAEGRNGPANAPDEAGQEEPDGAGSREKGRIIPFRPAGDDSFEE